MFPHAGIVATYPRTKRTAHAVAADCPRRRAWHVRVAEDCDHPATRGDGALAIVSANRLPEISPFPRNARRRGRRRYGKSSNAIVNRKSKIVNSQPPTIRRHLHLYTSTRPFFKSLNAPILKCNRKSEIAYCVRIGECGIIRARFCNWFMNSMFQYWWWRNFGLEIGACACTPGTSAAR